ncbi:siderophore-interacting protein [Arthrobacter sp. OV608]|nr:siderophore-interacting protein [Arthrobacter sp. OV608]SEQ26503.1 Siderophore-interacting FAD-binding domain-containing protein [Arthrobacter sp. OV608]
MIPNYTVRSYRPDLVELYIDFVVHGIGGVAALWMLSVQPGA